MGDGGRCGMRTLTAFLLIFVPLAAYAGCRSDLPVPVVRGKEIHFRISMQQEPTGSIHVRLTSGGKLMRNIAVGEDGAFTLDGIPEGKYRLFVPGWGNAALEVKPLTGTAFDDLDLPTFALVASKSRNLTINGNKVITILG